MTYVVAGVSGNTGSVVADTLLSQKKSVRVIVRDEAKGSKWKARGAEVAVASLDDEKALTLALQGAEGAYLLLPPFAFGATNVVEGHHRTIDAIARAIAASGVRHVVFLSSIGAQHDKGTGPIASLAYAEKKLRSLKTPITFLRASYFVENFAASFAGLPHGVLPTNLTADRAIPMVSTKDIGLNAGRLLLEPASETRTFELAGPIDLTPNAVAEAVSKITDKKVALAASPADASMVKTLQGYGASAEVAELYREMTDAVNQGVVDWAPSGTTKLRGKTPVEETLRGLLQKS